MRLDWAPRPPVQVVPAVAGRTSAGVVITAVPPPPLLPPPTLPTLQAIYSSGETNTIALAIFQEPLT
jgi:hypothetical protein